jgi:hypothetical protein
MLTTRFCSLRIVVSNVATSEALVTISCGDDRGPPLTVISLPISLLGSYVVGGAYSIDFSDATLYVGSTTLYYERDKEKNEYRHPERDGGERSI